MRSNSKKPWLQVYNMHHIISTFQGGMAFTTDLDGHPITIDLKPASGGNNKGPSPKILMLVSLAGCTGVDIVMILNKMRVEFSDFSIEIYGHLTETEPRTY